MKKLLFILALCVLLPQNVFAVSGACSYHGGVSCSAGADWDGSVICNDGWKDSSIKYGDMIMCSNQPSYSCSGEQYRELQGKWGLEKILTEIDTLQSQKEELKNQYSPVDASIYSLSISEQQQALLDEFDYKNMYVKQECATLGQQRYYEELERQERENREERERYLEALKNTVQKPQPVPIKTPAIQPKPKVIKEEVKSEQKISSPAEATTTSKLQNDQSLGTTSDIKTPKKTWYRRLFGYFFNKTGK
jgi:hypothetical protein